MVKGTTLSMGDGDAAGGSPLLRHAEAAPSVGSPQKTWPCLYCPGVVGFCPAGDWRSPLACYASPDGVLAFLPPRGIARHAAGARRRPMTSAETASSAGHRSCAASGNSALSCCCTAGPGVRGGGRFSRVIPWGAWLLSAAGFAALVLSGMRAPPLPGRRSRDSGSDGDAVLVGLPAGGGFRAAAGDGHGAAGAPG